MAHQLPDALTGRELDIARLIADGLTNHEIAQELVLTHGTVKWYCGQIYGKLGVSTRSEAIQSLQRLHSLEKSSGSTAPASRLRLPTPLTPFIGHQREILEIRHLLQTNRLLTLTGAGGIGKTRLALVVAAEAARDFTDGVSFIDLAPFSDASLVAKAIAHALGIMENPNETLLDTLKRALAEQEHLLLIDNFEQVIEGAPIIPHLLASAPRVKILVTSREALRISGEQEFAVPPLTLPTSQVISRQQLAQSEATSLFMQRVRMALPDFQITDDNASPIAQICARLDGLPLAIELAAARCKLLSPQAMLTRLESRLNTLTGGSRDAPARQQTLRRTIEWSYNLLDEGEKLLFARLAVFRGGRSLEAVEAICGAGLPIDVLSGLASLVDKSLVQQKVTTAGEPRFVMLETLHEFASERLIDSGEAETIRRHHADYFVTLAERAEPELRLARQQYWFQILELEYENLRAVLEWSLVDGDVTLGVRVAGALYLFWWANGYHVEGRYWTQQLLGRLEETPVIYHAKFLLSAGHIISLHDLEMSKHLLTRMLHVARELGDKYFIAWAFTYLGFAFQNESDQAIRFAEEGLVLLRELDFKPGITQALNVVGLITTQMGAYDRARRAYDECLTLSQQTGEIRQTCLVSQNFAFLAQRQGDHERAWNAAQQALHLAQKMGNRLLIATSLAVYAGSLELLGQTQNAARALGTSEAVFEGMGAFHQPIDKPEIDRITAAVRAQLDEATFQAAWAEGRKMTLEQAVADALTEEP